MYIDPCTDPLNATLDKRTLLSARQVMLSERKEKKKERKKYGRTKKTEESPPRHIGTGFSFCAEMSL